MKKETVKNSEVKKSVTKKTGKVENIKTANLAAYAERLANFDIKEKAKKERKYIYPENFTELMINNIEGKKHRSKLRKILERHCNNIFVFTKIEDVEKLKKEISLFLDFYKANYRINDFSVNSVFDGSNEKKKNDLSFMLQIVKDQK